MESYYTVLLYYPDGCGHVVDKYGRISRFNKDTAIAKAKEMLQASGQRLVKAEIIKVTEEVEETIQN